MAKKVKFEEEQIVYIQGVDSSGGGGWLPKREIRSLSVTDCVSVGLVVEDRENEILITNSIGKFNGTTPSYNDVLAIPKVAITKIKTIRTPR